MRTHTMRDQIRAEPYTHMLAAAVTAGLVPRDKTFGVVAESTGGYVAVHLSARCADSDELGTLTGAELQGLFSAGVVDEYAPTSLCWRCGPSSLHQAGIELDAVDANQLTWLAGAHRVRYALDAHDETDFGNDAHVRALGEACLLLAMYPYLLEHTQAPGTEPTPATVAHALESTRQALTEARDQVTTDPAWADVVTDLTRDVTGFEWQPLTETVTFYDLDQVLDEPGHWYGSLQALFALGATIEGTFSAPLGLAPVIRYPIGVVDAPEFGGYWPAQERGRSRDTMRMAFQHAPASLVTSSEEEVEVWFASFDAALEPSG